MDKESDIDFAQGSEDEGEEENVSYPDDDIPLANLQSKWRTASNTQPFLILLFTRNVGQHHNLPTSASVLDFFFMFLPQLFFDLAAAETNRYAMQKAAERGLPDSAWQETTPEEIRAYVAVLIMMGINQKTRLWCYWSTDLRFNDPWISSVITKTRFL